MNKYGYVRPGYRPEEHDWHAIEDCLPDAAEEADSFYDRSPSVLLWIRSRGGYALVGHLQWYKDSQDSPASWYLDGRDRYKALNVTHWRWLPAPPNGDHHAQ